MTEVYSPDKSFTSREILRKRSQVILTEEFAERVNSLAGEMEDEQLLATLFAPFDTRNRWRAELDGITYSKPTQEWTDFMDSLKQQEFVHLIRLINTAVWDFRLKTVGDIRNFTAQDLKGLRWMGPRGIAFATLAFGKKELSESKS